MMAEANGMATDLRERALAAHRQQNRWAAISETELVQAAKLRLAEMLWTKLGEEADPAEFEEVGDGTRFGQVDAVQLGWAGYLWRTSFSRVYVTRAGWAYVHEVGRLEDLGKLEMRWALQQAGLPSGFGVV